MNNNNHKEENSNKKLTIGISFGDINGIGLEVMLKTLVDTRILDLCTPVIYGSTKIISYHKNIINAKRLPLNNTNDISEIKEGKINVVNSWFENVKITLGECNETGGKYAYISLEKAVKDLKAQKLDALVTLPINKKAMQMAKFEYPGHTEYLTARLEAKESLMLMVHDNLRVGLVTNHLPIQQVAASITQQKVLDKINLLNHTLKMDFGINKPTIAILGLNPHAGDGGAIGDEEENIIIPAIEKAKEAGILAIGPYPADGFFGNGNYANFDGILALYHDQGLIPFKTLAYGGGINFTAGLPIIRTSPDHGTGFDIVGKGTADPSSFRKALYLAIDTARQRADYKEMTANPLQPISIKEINKQSKKKRAAKKAARAKERQEKKPKNEEKKEATPDKAKEEATPKKKPQKKINPKEEKPQKPSAEQSNTKKVLTEEEKKNLTIEERLALAEKKKAQEEEKDVKE